MNNTTKGSLYIIISAIFYASYGIWSRLMSDGFGEFNQAWTRGVILLVAVIAYLLATGSFKPIKSTDRKWFIIIGLCGSLNQAPYFFGFEHLPLGTAILIFYASLTLAGYILGKFAFGETIDRPKQISFILAIIGMSIIYKFSLTNDQLLPAILMSIAGFMGGTAGILPKKLSSCYSEPQILVSYLSLMIVANYPLSLFFGENLPPLTQTTAWIPQLGYAASMLIANLTVIAGFKYIEASIGTLIGLVEILFGVLFGYFLFGETLSLTTYLGAGLILFSASFPYFFKDR